MDPSTKLTKARTQLLIAHPFFSVIVLRGDPKPDNSIPAVQYDGHILKYNEQFVEEHSVPELMGVMAQAALHIGLLHHTRRNGRDQEKWLLSHWRPP